MRDARQLAEAPALVPQEPEQAIADRIEGLAQWLADNCPECSQQAHLDEGSSERAYWHYGYLQALRDVQNLLNGRKRTLN